MRTPRTALLLLALATVAVLLAACTGSTPTDLRDIPVYAGSQPVEPGSNYITEALFNAIGQSIADQNLASQISLYRLPEGTGWDSVKQFYTAEIGDDWKAAADLTQEAGVINIIGWQRGSGASEQVLIIGQAQDPLSNEEFLILGLFSEQPGDAS